MKFEDFEAHGVAEYWIVDADAGIVEQYLRRGEMLELAMKSSTGGLRSEAIRGFAAPVAAFFDARENLTALRTLLAARVG